MSSDSIYCTYLTVYSGNRLPPFYIGKSTVKKVHNGYHGSVSSQSYKNIWEEELTTNPSLFKTTIIKRFENKVEASIHEIYLLRFFNAHKNSMYINKHIGGVSFNLDEQLQNGTHHFQNREKQRELNMRQVRAGTHHFQNVEFQREMSRRAKSKAGFHDRQSAVAKQSNADRIARGTHHFLHHGAHKKAWIQTQMSREIVQQLRALVEQYELKMERMWDRKPDDWINLRLREVLQCVEVGVFPPEFLTSKFPPTVKAVNIKTGERRTLSKQEFDENADWVGHTAVLRRYKHNITGEVRLLYARDPQVKSREYVLSR